MDKLFAGIVTYNPDIHTLNSNIESITKQLKTVVIVDNGSQNIKRIEQLALEYNVQVIKNKKNLGIATALNQLMEYGSVNKFFWMLSLDQDSVCQSDYCSKISELFEISPNIGIIGPVIHDRKVGIIGHNPQGLYGVVNTCITSGACTKVNVWETVGKYDEKMFIDSVDFEFCYRVRKKGYLVIQTRNVILEHSLGEGRLVGIGHLKKRINEHSAFRCFYMAQNRIYYPRKHKLYLYIVRGNLRNLEHILQVILFEKDKVNKIYNILKGWKMGYYI